jgi:hypothetical protein
MFIPDPKISIPKPGSKRHRIPDPQQRIYLFLTQKVITKLSEIGSWTLFSPDPDFFIPDLDPGDKKNTGYRIRNTV